MRSGGGIAEGISKAMRAIGPIVIIEPNDFMTIILKSDSPLVVQAESGFITTTYQYLTSYKGLVFFTKSPDFLQFGDNVEVISAKMISIPG